jgi:hypothetical protein
MFFFQKKVPKIRRPRSRSKNPRSVLEILVCALTLKDEGWPWELYYHHGNINMYIYIYTRMFIHWEYILVLYWMYNIYIV